MDDYNFNAQLLWAVRPDVGVKNSPMVSITCPKSSQSVFFHKGEAFQNSQKVTNHLGNFR